MKIKIKLSIIFSLIFCLFAISSADVGIGISEVGIISSITSIENENKAPAKLGLNQNYPNPFNPSTTIEFALPKPNYVELKVYNILGKEVAELVSNDLPAGEHLYQFDGTDLASGIYYYQIVAGEYREVKKMILLR